MKMAEPGFWDDQTKAQTVINENNELKAKYDNFHQLATAVEELEVLYELVQEAPEAEMLTELAETYAMTKQKLESYQLTLLLNEPYDKDDAILEIHPGAGGTESQDWGSMLLRMYTRWAEQHNFTVTTQDYQPGDEAGIKSVTLTISGHNAYGYLRGEKGVHRLDRKSVV